MGGVTAIAHMTSPARSASKPANVASIRPFCVGPARPTRALSPPAGAGDHGVPVHTPIARPLELAIQRQADTTPIGLDGEEVLALSRPSGRGPGTDNVEDPDASLTAIEEGAPFGADARNPLLEQERGAVQAAGDGASPKPARVSANGVLVLLGSGQALAAPLRARMEAALGHDFGRVRVHADSRGAELSRAFAAHAFTVGEHIAFATGRYRPAHADGQRLVAHELTHVIQQRRGLGSTILGDGIGRADDAYERDAEATAQRVTAAGPDSPGRERPPLARPEAATVALQLYSGTAAASYAKKWANGINPAYGKLGDDDCTNFVSQAMVAGGWTYVWGFHHAKRAIRDMGICELRKTNSVWWFKRDQCYRPWPWSNIHASHTWGGAENFYQFLDTSGRGTKLKAISDLDVGDVLQRDHNDNHVHHTMVVTEKGPQIVDGKSIIQLKLSYHSNNTLNRPFWGKGNILDTTPAGWKYFAWSIK
jgi:hypothetical protein